MTQTLQGVGVSPGTAVGPAYLIIGMGEANRSGATVEEEQRAFDEAREAGTGQLEELAARLRATGHEAEAGIMDAQVLMLQDPAFLDKVQRNIAGGQPADLAVHETSEHFAQAFEGLDDPYLAARAADVRDVGARIRRHLLGASHSPVLQRASIIVARDLTPSQTAALDRTLVLGLATETGGPTSHTAILARALRIPAVVGVPAITEHVSGGAEIILDGETGTIIVDPGPDARATSAVRAGRQDERARMAWASRSDPAETLGGHRLIVAANIGSPDEVPAALDAGAEGVGLFRTEFLFAGRQEMPGEAEQVEVYRSVLAAMSPHTVVIRTLDVGGDKPLPSIPSVREANPFLGERGIRHTLAHPDILRVQLRALLRAAPAGRLAVMFPMISDLPEIARARQFLAEAQDEVGGSVEVGIMVEVPAAALLAEKLAHHVSFFSVGSNDLVQYTLAIDRVNERVAALYQPLHPAVLRLLQMTVQGGHAKERWVGICGEMAGDQLAIPLLVGLGFDELSMSPSRIPAAKLLIRTLDRSICQNLADRALSCETSNEVEDLIRSEIPL